MSKIVTIYKNKTQNNGYMYDVYVEGNWAFSRCSPDNVFRELCDLGDIVVSFIDQTLY